VVEVALGTIVLPNDLTFSIFLEDEISRMNNQNEFILHSSPSLRDEPLITLMRKGMWEWVYKILMIILNWNIRGLGDLDNRAKVRDFIYLYDFDVISLQEIKLFSPTFHILWFLLGSLDQ